MRQIAENQTPAPDTHVVTFVAAIFASRPQALLAPELISQDFQKAVLFTY